MSIAERDLRKLASKLNKNDMAVIGELLQKVAADSARAGASAAANQDAALEKIASDLVAQGFSDDEIVLAVEKIAEEQKVAAECGNITQDCMAMGTLMGKQASAVIAESADSLATYIGKKAAAVCVSNLRQFVKGAEAETEAEDEAKEEKAEGKEHEAKESPEFQAGESEEEKEDEAEDEKEDEGEKEASVNRRVALLRAILSGTGLEGAV